MSNKRTALLAACLIPACALALVLISAHITTLYAMAAPPPPTPGPSGVQPPISNPQSPTSDVPICFYRDHALTCVDRAGVQKGPQPGDEARALIQALVDGPTSAERAAGIRSALPEGAQLADVSVAGDAVTIKLVLPESFLYGGLDPLVSDEITEQVVKTLYPLDNLRKFTILAQDPHDSAGTFKPLSYFLFEPPVTHKSEQTKTSIPMTAYSTAGALAGKGVYLSAGHGWFWQSYQQTWLTQRYAQGSNQIIEDMNNAEVVNQYLVQYLRNAGADVWPVREHDMNTQEMIVVHGQPAYSEVGSWNDSTQTGYQGQVYRYANSVTSGATATATWRFTPTVTGRYAVYAWYRVFDFDGNTHAPDVQYLVVHDGGTTEVHVNQGMHGNTWRYIGTFPFAANAPGAVMLTNHSTVSGKMVTADAVRVGGGMGTLVGDINPVGPSGKPRWEEAARYWAKYQGAPSSVYAPGGCEDYYGLGTTEECQDVTTRPRYAEWERESSQDSVYLSWHSNGYNGSARGTESYVYDGGFTPGSDQLQSWVHSTLISDIRAGWDSNWTDRGMKQANLGELRPLQTMPGTLIEVAFHDQADDANALKDARFAQLTARAIYKGIVRYFAEKDFTTPVILPEPPQNLVVRNSGPGQVTISWRPSPTDTIGLLGDAATGYRVYTSTDGLGWNDGVPVSNNAFTLTGLAQGIVFVRVTATNAGGESFPTPVASARVATGGPAPVLIVNGYERIDRWMDVMRCDTPSANCPNARIWPAQMNDQSYVVQHGTAITLPFDSAMRGAVDNGDVTLDAYDIVDWIAGQEQVPASVPQGTNEVALTQAERDTLSAYLSGGHALLISGAEVAFDLATNTNSQSFLTGTLHAQFAGDDANTFAVTPTLGGIFAGVGQFSFDDGTQGSYAVNYPDFITPTNGSIATLNYVTSPGKVAAVQYANGCQRLVYLGFPFETIYPAATRQAVMSRAMNFLGACLRQPPIVAIASPTQGGFYKNLPPINGLASDWTQVDHVDVAMVQVTAVQVLSGTAWVPLTPTLRFLSGTDWVTSETWLSATGSTTWSFTPTITLADGPYAVWARAWNSAGFSSTQIAVISFTMDTIAPTVPTPITPTGSITLSSLSVSLVFSPAIDLNGVAGYNVRVDGALYTTTATALPVSGLSVGSHTWDVRAFDVAGNASSWSQAAAFATDHVLVYLPLIMRDYTPSAPPASRCQEVVTNGGFETQSAWYSVASVPPTYVHPPDHVYSGTASLLIGYTTTVNVPTTTVYSSIQQTITIPFTATQTTLTFWRYPMSSDSSDYQYVSVGPTPTSATTIVWSRASNEQAWTQTVVDLSTYTGTLTLRFGVVNKGGDGVTAMYLDDVSVQSCGP
jgi:hypothetical protein